MTVKLASIVARYLVSGILCSSIKCKEVLRPMHIQIHSSPSPPFYCGHKDFGLRFYGVAIQVEVSTEGGAQISASPI